MNLPLVQRIAYRDPVMAFAPLAGDPMAVLLDSALPSAQGRYSYIAVEPFQVVRATPRPWCVSVDTQPVSGDPFAAVARTLAPFRGRQPDLPVPFGGGAIGLFAYELGGVLENLPQPRAAMFACDMVVGLYDVVAAFDHITRDAWVISTGWPETGVAQARRAMQRAEALQARLGDAPLADLHGGWPAVWRCETSRAAHEANVAAAIELISAGDIFQANITQRFVAETPVSLDWWALYRRLRDVVPAPYAAFFNAGDELHLLSASPERFLSLDRNGRVETRPIKGTRPRGATATEDSVLADALLSSTKDRAENLMIVDLLRNDLARVCRPGSIDVPVLCGLEQFPAVHHLVSVVTGQLRPDADAIALLRACFPGGSVTGAPKIRAMEVIHDLEAGPRGFYCGALAWLGFDGAMDSSIVIRSLVGDDRRIYAQAGGGIVAESDPALEYDESRIKAAALLAALTDRAPL